MAIPREYASSNPLVRDAMALIPLQAGEKVGDFVAPDYPIDAELVSNVTVADHSLDLDDLRAPDAEAKSIRFETGSTTDISVVERGKKSTIDSRKLEEAGARGVDELARRSALIRDDILDAKEYRIAAAVMNAGNYDSDHKDESGLDLSTADLVKTFDGWQDNIRRFGRFGKARRLLLGLKAWRGIRVNEGFVKFVSTPGVLTAGSRQRLLMALADYLELDEVRVADFSRVLAGQTDPTQFWTEDSMLLFVQNNTLSNKTLAATPVVPYGQYQNVAQGTLVDVRVKQKDTVDNITEFGSYHRYRTYLLNAKLGFLATRLTGWEEAAS